MRFTTNSHPQRKDFSLTQNFIAIWYLIKRIRRRYSNDTRCENIRILQRIIDYSLPVVYGDCYTDLGKVAHAAELRKGKKRRTQKYIEDMFVMYDELFFVTLTFTDEVLNNTSEQTRHRYASRWLNQNTRNYIANVDYGHENHREHYHAVVALSTSDFEAWEHGFSNIKPITTCKGKKTASRVAKYITKLTNHAEKLTTGRTFHKRGLVDCDNLPF